MYANVNIRKIALHLLLAGVFLLLVVGNYQKGLGQTTDTANNNNHNNELVSPYKTIYTHLHNLENNNFKPEQAAQVFYQTPLSEGKQLAIQLKQIYDGKGLYVNMSTLPTAPNYIDTISNKARYVLFEELPNIYVEKINGKWYYGPTTIQNIQEIYTNMYPYGIGNFMLQVKENPTLNKRFIGISVWLIVALLLMGVFSLLFYWLFNKGVQKGLNKLIDQNFEANLLPKKEIIKLSKAFSLFILVKLITNLLPVLQLHAIANKYLIIILNIIALILVIKILLILIDLLLLYLQSLANKTENTLDNQLLTPIGKALHLVVYVFGFIYLLKIFGVDVSALLAGISIGGIALALAAQDTLKNLFGSIMIFLDRPFQIGEAISFDGTSGVVQEVGLRSTRVRTFQNSLVSVPNAVLANATVDNIGKRQIRRWSTTLGLTYNTPPYLITLFVEGVREIITRNQSTVEDKTQVYLNEFNASSLDIMIYLFFKVDTWSEELQARQDIMFDIITLAEQLHVTFAFPSSSIYIENNDTDNGQPAQSFPDHEEAKATLEQFFNNL